MKISNCEKEIKDEFNSITEEIKQLEVYRNEFVHSMWTYDKKENMMLGRKLVKSRMSGVDLSEKYADIGEMDEQYKRMYDVFHKLVDFTDNILFPGLGLEPAALINKTRQ